MKIFIATYLGEENLSTYISNLEWNFNKWNHVNVQTQLHVGKRLQHIQVGCADI
jgi:hypothetical protein